MREQNFTSYNKHTTIVGIRPSRPNYIDEYEKRNGPFATEKSEGDA